MSPFFSSVSGLRFDTVGTTHDQNMVSPFPSGSALDSSFHQLQSSSFASFLRTLPSNYVTNQVQRGIQRQQLDTLSDVSILQLQSSSHHVRARRDIAPRQANRIRRADILRANASAHASNGNIVAIFGLLFPCSLIVFFVALFRAKHQRIPFPVFFTALQNHGAPILRRSMVLYLQSLMHATNGNINNAQLESFLLASRRLERNFMFWSLYYRLFNHEFYTALFFLYFLNRPPVALRVATPTNLMDAVVILKCTVLDRSLVPIGIQRQALELFVRLDREMCFSSPV